MQKNQSILFVLACLVLTSGIILFDFVSLNNEAKAQRRGPSPEVKAIIQSLSPEEREIFFSLDHFERREFIMKRLPSRKIESQQPAHTRRNPQKGFRYFETKDGGINWSQSFASVSNMSTRGGVDPEVFFGSDGKVWIYYFGSNNTRGDPAKNQPDDTWRILIAKSNDDGKSFVEIGVSYQENQGLTDPFIVKLRNGSYRMYISRGASVFSALSKDGISYVVEEGKRVSEGNGGVPGALQLEDGSTVIFVCQRDGIYSSVSRDGLEFDDFEMVLEAPRGKMICDPSPEKINNNFYVMAYKEKPENVRGPHEDYVRIAKSKDGLNWEKKEELVGTGSVPALLVLDESHWKIYVSGPPPHAKRRRH